MIKAVIFDIDGVLLDSFQANFKFYHDLMTANGYRPFTLEEFAPLFHLTLWDAVKAMTKSDSEEEIRRIWEIGRRRDVKYDTSLLTMPAGAAEVIDALSHFYRLGIVTSRVQNSVYEFADLAGLKDYFQAVVVFEDTIKHKPDPEPLLLAASRLGASPAECVYIGDVANDITAARSAGTKIIIYSPQPLAAADANTPDFRRLPELIAALSGGGQKPARS
ncbi:MAG: HAD family hydrolase [Patescibacteria group bacterium]